MLKGNSEQRSSCQFSDTRYQLRKIFGLGRKSIKSKSSKKKALPKNLGNAFFKLLFCPKAKFP
jgi:hypothetical protein